MEIHQRDIRMEVGDRKHGFLRGLVAGDDVDRGVMEGEKLAQPLPEQPVVLDEDYVKDVGRALVAHVELMFGVGHGPGSMLEGRHGRIGRTSVTHQLPDVCSTGKMTTIRLLLADAHAATLAGLRMALSGDPFTVVA